MISDKLCQWYNKEIFNVEKAKWSGSWKMTGEKFRRFKTPIRCLLTYKTNPDQTGLKVRYINRNRTVNIQS
jgi:hypothetical protein